jgi:hypothetical protein
MLLAAEIWGVNTEILQRLHVDQRGVHWRGWSMLSHGTDLHGNGSSTTAAPTRWDESVMSPMVAAFHRLDVPFHRRYLLCRF